MNGQLGAGDETKMRLLAGFGGLDEDGGQAGPGGGSGLLGTLAEKMAGILASLPRPPLIFVDGEDGTRTRRR